MPIVFPQVWFGLYSDFVNSRFVPNFVLWVVHRALSPTAALHASSMYVSLNLSCTIGARFSLLSIPDKKKWKRDHITVETSAGKVTVPLHLQNTYFYSASVTTLRVSQAVDTVAQCNTELVLQPGWPADRQSHKRSSSGNAAAVKGGLC